jgi:phosphoribosylglycinamide formyltransferase-1
MESKINKKIVFLCSGGGGNLRFINIAIENKWIKDASIVLVITDRECPAKNYASTFGINNKQMNFDLEGQKAVLDMLVRTNPDIIVANIHKILFEPIVNQFKGKLINLHYSILPSFGRSFGMNSVQSSINYGARFTGVTTHFVSMELDSGKPIVQVAIPLKKDEENFDYISSIVFKAGCLALITGINSILLNNSKSKFIPEARVNIDGKKCFFSDVTVSCNEINKPKVWRLVHE